MPPYLPYENSKLYKNINTNPINEYLLSQIVYYLYQSSMEQGGEKAHL